MNENDDIFHMMPQWDIRAGLHPFTYPFAYTPDRYCKEAVKQLQAEIKRHADWSEELKGGKMFGVLTCEAGDHRVGFIASFSGTLGGRLRQGWFVPPVLDYENNGGTFKNEEKTISDINKAIEELENSAELRTAKETLSGKENEKKVKLLAMKAIMAANKAVRQQMRLENPALAPELTRQSQFEKAELKRAREKMQAEIDSVKKQIATKEQQITALKDERKRRSNILQRWLFSRTKLHCADGAIESVWDIFRSANRGVPPAGSGECAAPKLLNYAFARNLKPISMAEIWVGRSPKGEIRIDGEYYPACQTKCGPILKRMTRGMNVAANPLTAQDKHMKVLYEDEWLIIVDKPAGLMTASDDTAQDTLMSRVKKMRPDITGPGYVHRLDMATSGIVIVAKDKETHAAMQHLFETRQVKKVYVAMVEGSPRSIKGTISLPLIPNIEDRPRQMVDFVRGKEATTLYEVVGHSAGRIRLMLYPKTGRTHQLRIHMASPLGLGCPIVGDNLYGHLGERMLLHARMVEFTHPWTSTTIVVRSEPDF